MTRLDAGLRPVFEYTVRRVDGEGTGDIGRICSEHAKGGWRLVSTNVARLEKFDHDSVPVLRA